MNVLEHQKKEIAWISHQFFLCAIYKMPFLPHLCEHLPHQLAALPRGQMCAWPALWSTAGPGYQAQNNGILAA